MGHWSQYRHRGRGAAASQLYAPPAPDIWNLTIDGGPLNVEMLDEPPVASIDGVQAEFYRPDNPTLILEVAYAAGRTPSFDSAGTFDETMAARVRYMVGAAPVSGWSEQKTVTYP